MQLKKIVKKIAYIFLAAAIIFSCGAPWEQAVAAAPKTGLQVTLKTNSTCAVNIAQAAIKERATRSSKTLEVVKKGVKLTVLGKSGTYYKVKTPSGKTGFVYGGSVVESAAIVAKKLEKSIILATTTSTNDTGLLGVLVPAFEKKYGVSVKIISVGTGEALRLGQMGDADVVLVHARAQEDSFVANGYGVNRRDVMHNDFFIVGPKDDPAKVAAASDANAAMKAIFDSGSEFISRGDNSGTHSKEKTLWSTAKLSPAKEKWYIAAGIGMGDTLLMANEKSAYTLTDSGTWFAFQDKLPNLKVVRKGDKILLNPYGVIAVNPAKHKNAHYNSAMAFIDFITSAEGQTIIGNFKVNGQQLFTPEGAYNLN
jgi:tungstate transport system substrate-binding protein